MRVVACVISPAGDRGQLRSLIKMREFKIPPPPATLNCRRPLVTRLVMHAGVEHTLFEYAGGGFLCGVPNGGCAPSQGRNQFLIHSLDEWRRPQMTIRIVTQIISGKVFNESEIGVTLLIELNLKSTGKCCHCSSTRFFVLFFKLIL